MASERKMDVRSVSKSGRFKKSEFSSVGHYGAKLIHSSSHHES
jgi:hypothetical protein